MNKKLIALVLILIIIILLTLFIREKIIYFNGNLEKNNIMSKEEIKQLLDKGENYENYYYSPTQNPQTTNEEIKTEYYIKNGIVATYINSQLIQWVNYNTGEIISLIHNNNQNTFSSSNNVKRIQNNQNGVDYSEIIDNKYKYKYLGKKIFQDRKAIYIELRKDDIVKQFVIDEKSGLILESKIGIKKFGLITVSLIRNKENIKFDIVSDENVKKPNLNN